MSNIRNRYDEVFQIEMEGWAYGLQNYPGEIFPELVFRIIRELEQSFTTAFEHAFSFDAVELGKIFSKAAKYLVHEKDITFCILSVLPPPQAMSEDAQYAMANVIDQVEQTYGGALSRMEKKWTWEVQNEIRQNETRQAEEASEVGSKKFAA